MLLYGKCMAFMGIQASPELLLNSELAAAHALLSAVVQRRVTSHVVMQHLDLI